MKKENENNKKILNKKEGKDSKKLEIKDESPIKLLYLKFESDSNNNNQKTEEKEKQLSMTKNGYEPGSLFYDKFSKRIIYFSFAEHSIYIYNRTKTTLKKKMKVFFNYKVLNACVDKKLTYLLIFANPNINNKFIFVYCISKETFLSQLKEDYSYLLNMFFIEKNFFCLVFADKIKFYICNQKSDEIKQVKTLDYSKLLINNFFFVRQYLILLILRGDNSFDMYSLRKNEIELIKTFNEVFNTRSVMFKSSSSKTSFFSNLFSSRTENLKARQLEIMNNYHNVFGNIYKNNQFFLEYIYSNLYFILLSYEDNAIFMMNIKNINKFPKEEEGNKIIKLQYRTHSNNSTIQFFDNLLFVHNFSTDNTIIFDVELQAKTKIVCSANNILKNFHDESFIKLNVLGGNIEETCRIKNEKGQQELTKKLYSLILDLENLFKNNGNKNKNKLNNSINVDENELDGMLMIARRNKSKIFFLELFNKMLLDKTINHRTDKIQLLLKEFSRQIQKSNTLALDLMSNAPLINDAMVSAKTVKLSYKKDNEKFYLDDKYIMLSTKNTLSQIEVIKSFKRIVQESEKNNIDDESIFEYLFYILYFYLQLSKNKIEVIKLYYDTIMLLFKQIKEEKKLIKFITFFTGCKFPFCTAEIGRYLLDNYSNSTVIKLEGYKILKSLGYYNDLFYYLLKNESFSFAMKYLQEIFDKNKVNDIKKIFLNYLNNCKDNIQIRELLEEYVQDDDDF
jgi:hypothetical protein